MHIASIHYHGNGMIIRTVVLYFVKHGYSVFYTGKAVISGKYFFVLFLLNIVPKKYALNRMQTKPIFIITMESELSIIAEKVF